MSQVGAAGFLKVVGRNGAMKSKCGNGVGNEGKFIP